MTMFAFLFSDKQFGVSRPHTLMKKPASRNGVGEAKESKDATEQSGNANTGGKNSPTSREKTNKRQGVPPAFAPFLGGTLEIFETLHL